MIDWLINFFTSRKTLKAMEADKAFFAACRTELNEIRAEMEADRLERVRLKS
jgi:hypothetical protein